MYEHPNIFLQLIYIYIEGEKVQFLVQCCLMVGKFLSSAFIFLRSYLHVHIEECTIYNEL